MNIWVVVKRDRKTWKYIDLCSAWSDYRLAEHDINMLNHEYPEFAFCLNKINLIEQQIKDNNNEKDVFGNVFI